jgi:hypothetical protein
LRTLTATSTPTVPPAGKRTPTVGRTPTQGADDPTPTDDGILPADGDGFGIVGAISALRGIAYLLRWLGDTDE